jgi:ABC-type dipeptide/oligopeptide/nickel transport system permease component
MTATNHALTGSIIAAAVPNPVIGLPLALLSHFVLDALPHFGAHTVANPKTKEFRAILITDSIMTAVLLLFVAFASYRMGMNWFVVFMGGFLAWLPDVMWYKHYQSDLRGEPKQWDRLRTFHKKIQQWEVSWGWAVEIVWFVAGVLVLNRIIFQ